MSADEYRQRILGSISSPRGIGNIMVWCWRGARIQGPTSHWLHTGAAVPEMAPRPSLERLSSLSRRGKRPPRWLQPKSSPVRTAEPGGGTECAAEWQAPVAGRTSPCPTKKESRSWEERRQLAEQRVALSRASGVPAVAGPWDARRPVLHTAAGERTPGPGNQVVSVVVPPADACAATGMPPAGIAAVVVVVLVAGVPAAAPGQSPRQGRQVSTRSR